MATRQPRSPQRPPVLADGTRERLLGNALRLFAEDGLKGVSLRRIVAESGAANPSALHYHVGNREDLIEQLAGQVFARLRAAALPRLQALAGKRHTVRDVLEAMFLPVLELRESGADGLSAVQFLARLS